jgi:eukaryotic-like serine/threonine-protein kinase
VLEREIGRGGMGAVWLGRDEVLGRDVALKRLGLAPGGSTPDLARAEREARLAARLNHPHVVAIYDLVIETDEQWLVMEYVEGTTLSALVQRDGALTPDTAARILRQVADALAAAHAAGIVHRDVKPSNILVAPDGQVKLSDFGIARAEADASLTQTGLVTGSPAYLSPEVASGQQATPASDVWSLGATAYYTLAGHPPYDVSGNLLGAMYRIVHEDPPRLTNAGWLAPLLESTMTTDPAERWPMAQARDFLAGAPAPEPTRTLRAVPPPPTAPAPTPAPAPAPAPVPARARRSASGALAMALAVAAIVVVAIIAWQLGSDGDGGESPSADPAPTRTGGQQSSPPPTSESPEAVTADGMESFVEEYLATVTTDQQASWEMLTPEFQDASGGFGQYQKFWRGFTSADLLTSEADPDSMQIGYTVQYQRTDGSELQDQVTLTLEGTDGAFLIAGEG